MANPIAVNDAGLGGVNVDDEPYDLADNQLRVSQNATLIRLAGRKGSLQTRRGYARFNTTALGGPVLGGIEAPYQGTASAPSSGGGGGGNPGDSGGTGQQGQGSGVGPGDGTGSGTSSASASAATAVNPSGRRLFGGARLILIGRVDNTTAKSGWYLSDAGLVDTALKLNTGTSSDGGTQVTMGDPGLNNAFPAVMVSLGGSDSAGFGGGRAFTTANGVLYYSESLATASSASPVLPTIRKLAVDGSSDLKILTVPENPYVVGQFKSGNTVPNHCSAVASFATQWGNGDIIFFTVVDKVTSGGNAGLYGRVMLVQGLDSGAYTCTEIYNSLNTNSSSAVNSVSQVTVPYVLENYLGNLWVGFYRGSAVPLATWCMLRPDTTQPDNWGCTKVTSDTGSHVGDVTCLRTFTDGNLYVGFQNWDPSVAAAWIDQYAPDGTVTKVLTAAGGTILTQNFFTSMEIFNGNLYASWYNGVNACLIYKYDGASWTTAFTASSGQRVPLILRADGSYLYAFGGTALSSPQVFLSTPDGTTWTDQSANFTTAANMGNSSPVPVLYGIDQH